MTDKKYRVKEPNSGNKKVNGRKFKLLPQDDYNLIVFRPYVTKKPELIEEILSIFTGINFTIFRKKFIERDKHFWYDYFYPSDEKWLENIGFRVLKDNKEAGIKTKDIIGTNDPVKIGLAVKKWLCRDMDNKEKGPSLSVVVVGHNAAIRVKEMFGPPIPVKAPEGTIRNKYGGNDSNPLSFSQRRSPYNVAHCSNRDEKRNGICAIRYETQLLYPELYF